MAVTTSPAAKDISTEERRAAAAAMGGARTPRKEAANRLKGHYGVLGGRPAKPLDELVCNCGAGMALTGHKRLCPRGDAIKRRLKAGTLELPKEETETE